MIGLVKLLLNILNGSLNFADVIVYILSSLFVVFGTMPVHEFAHALAADKLGDPTPRYNGRLTLNPLAHIDYLGAMLILVAGFGFAKPVPVNQSYFKHPKRDMAIVGLAGPLANVIVATILMLLCNALIALGIVYNGTVIYYIYLFLYYAAYINISLAAFNLIPIPPLDGSRILFAVLPDKYYYLAQQYERYIYFGVLLLAFTGALSVPMSYISDWIYYGIDFITSLPFKAFGLL